MKAINRIVVYYFVIALPLLAAAWVIFPAFTRTEKAVGSAFFEWGNAATGYLFSLWVVTALYVAVAVIVSPRFREHLLKLIARIKERDEREAMIVGRASRNVFLLNVALIVCLLIFNLVTVHVSRLPEGQTIAGKERNLFIGLNLSPVEGTACASPGPEGSGGQTLFDYHFPLSVSGVLYLMMIVNLGAFSYYARRLERG